MTALHRFMSVFLLLPALLLAGCGSDSTDSVTALTLSSSNSTLDITFPDRFVTITATVRDSENNLLPNANVRFSTNLGSFSPTSNVTSDSRETGRGGSQDAGNGVAAIKLYAGLVSGTATVTAFVNGIQQTVSVTINGPSGGGGTDTTNQARVISLVVSNATLDTAMPSRFVTLDATVLDKDNNPLSNAKVEFSASLGSFSSAGSVQTLTQETSSGVASLKFYPGTTAGTAQIRAYINGVESNLTLTIQGPTTGGGTGDTTTQAASVTLVASNAALDTSLPERFVTLDATVRDKDNNLLSNAKVEFTTSLGSFTPSPDKVQKLTQTTAAGVASLKIYPGSTAGAAQVKAYINGVESVVSLTITGPTTGGGNGDTTSQAVSLSLVVSNAALETSAPDRFVTLDAAVRDKDNNLLSNAQVEFTTSLGSFSNTASVQKLTQITASGVASLKMYPGGTAGTANVIAYINGTQAIATVTITGTVVVPEPPETSSITVSASEKAISVAGVGQLESSAITVRLLTSSGAVAQDAPEGVNNVRVSFVTQPNGGEYLLGTQASGQLAQNTKTLDVATTNGVATLSLNSGQLPGVIELKAEALDDQGLSYSPAIQTSISALSIASGPAHSIVFSYPVAAGIQNMNNGTYRREGGLLATDRYGNPVADGTVINLGVIDSVLLSNRAPQINYGFASTVIDGNASTTATSRLLTDLSNALFQSAVITRNNTNRFIEAQDRVLIFNAQAEDKSRFVAALPAQASTVTVNKNYLNTATQLEYLVGASLLGMQVSGVDPAKEGLVSGQAVTEDGAASFYLTYPANEDTILTSCVSSALDTRHIPQGSAQVFVVAEASGSSATTIDDRACFSYISPAVITSGITSISGDTILSLEVRDQGSVRLPFLGFDAGISYGLSNRGNLTVNVVKCLATNSLRTDVNGQCELEIDVSGGISGDTATVSLGVSSANALTINVTVP
jgi:2-keto-3-deoxy-6-phosphogluconate aldolase